jgi:hypothetical protein
LRPEDRPGDERNDRNHHDGRDEIEGEAVGQALDRRARTLRLGDELDDPRQKSTSSGFGPSSPVGTPIGSSAIPQIGQAPDLSRTISGCIGQVYCVPFGIACCSGLSPR